MTSFQHLNATLSINAEPGFPFSISGNFHIGLDGLLFKMHWIIVSHVQCCYATNSLKIIYQIFVPRMKTLNWSNLFRRFAWIRLRSNLQALNRSNLNSSNNNPFRIGLLLFDPLLLEWHIDRIHQRLYFEYSLLAL